MQRLRECGAELRREIFPMPRWERSMNLSAGTGGEPTGLSSAQEEPTVRSECLSRVVPGAVPERFENYQLLRKSDAPFGTWPRSDGHHYKAFDTDLPVDVVLR